MSQDKEVVVGIDLGTTNSVVAVVKDGKVVVIPVRGAQTMPSAVGLGPDGTLLVGQPAKNQAIAAPERTVLSIKRRMGTSDPVVLGDKSYAPEEISAVILRELKREAEAFLGVPVRKAVITVPAFFNERQRTATQDAGKLAGLEVLRIINEPTAAALAYGAGNADSKAREVILVYDLGGGTFDVSLVVVENGVVEVKASHGDTHLGGDDFDEALAKLAAERFLESNRSEESQMTPAVHRRLKAVMEKAKIALSDNSEVAVHEEFLTPNGHLNAEFARMEYEQLISPWVEKTLECLQRVLSDTGVTVSAIHKILLVGGVTRTPLVQQIIERRMHKFPHHEVDPDLIVAMGAAIQGATLAGIEAPAILVDVTAHTYSLEALSEEGHLVCAPLIPRGTPLPTKKSQVFFTAYPGQEKVSSAVYQGESRWPEHNLALGTLTMDGLCKTNPEHSPITATFSIDLNGLMRVSATEKSTGLTRSITIEARGHRINLDAARANLADLFAPAADDVALSGDLGDLDEDEIVAPEGGDEHNRLLADAKNLRHRAEKVLETGVTDQDAAEIRALLDKISAAIASSEMDTLGHASEKLSDLLFYLED